MQSTNFPTSVTDKKADIYICNLTHLNCFCTTYNLLKFLYFYIGKDLGRINITTLLPTLVQYCHHKDQVREYQTSLKESQSKNPGGYRLGEGGRGYRGDKW